MAQEGAIEWPPQTRKQVGKILGVSEGIRNISDGARKQCELWWPGRHGELKIKQQPES